MNLEINIIRGHKALNLLHTDKFISRWKELSKLTDKVTVFQESPFVLNWYTQYNEVYEPILVVGYNKNSEIIGLIPLAFSLKKHSLHHAGAAQAEYHGWLCEPDIQNDFLIKSLVKIKSNFNMRIWQWSWTPPRSDTKWLFSNELKAAGIYVETYEQDAPVLNLMDSDLLNKLKKSRSLKTKLNRFKRRENFHIERITSKEKAIAIFDTLEMQCDFRQMAANESTPFINDPIKKKFHIEKLNSPENIHFTVLWADDRPIAFNFGERDHETVYLGVMSYDPLDGKNSPGIIFIMQLADLLIEEGYRFFDLTPGGDKYKQKFCNSTQKVYLPTFYFNKKDKTISSIKGSVKKISTNVLTKIGLSSDSTMTKVANFTKSLKKVLKNGPVNLSKNLVSSLSRTNKILIYKIEIGDIPENSFIKPTEIAVNKYSDLLAYDSPPQGQGKKMLISSALKRFERENVLYTDVKNNILTHYCWLIKKAGKQRLLEVDMEFVTPENSFYIDDFFNKSTCDNHTLFQNSLAHIMSEAKLNNINALYMKISPNDMATIKFIESVGFALFKTFINKRTFWIVDKKEV